MAEHFINFCMADSYRIEQIVTYYEVKARKYLYNNLTDKVRKPLTDYDFPGLDYHYYYIHNKC